MQMLVYLSELLFYFKRCYVSIPACKSTISCAQQLMHLQTSLFPPSHSPIVINGTEVDLFSQAKLLGVVISNYLKWNQHVDAICKQKSFQHLYALRLLKRSTLPVDVLITLYRTIIRPILEYACEAWHYSRVCMPQNDDKRKFSGQ